MLFGGGIIGTFSDGPSYGRFAIREKRLYFFDIEVKEVSGVLGDVRDFRPSNLGKVHGNLIFLDIS